MRYRKKGFWRRLAVLDQVDQRFQQTKQKMRAREGRPTLEELAECQRIALELGTCLEGLGDIAVPAVRALEDYCESLYQQSVRIEDAAACRMISKRVQKELGLIRRIVQFDLPEGKKEILFLPYKASMWDSLESVWLAAQADADCEALVMPVPYFDKNPDGSLGQFHDEKDQYPDNVPVTDWQTYPLQERYPDAIFFHDPYDGCNHVTTVHPAFYARELKKYTDLLVYIPYFVGIDGHVDQGFCVLPGTLYADRVIVESPQVRAGYIDAFCRFEQENLCQGRFGDPKQKFLALGSPKLDRVRSVTRENITVPEGWEQLILKDGTRKKVILYNTSIGTFLQCGEDALKKIRHTLARFKGDPDMALLWRPHPLLEATIRSMRPDLYPEFCRIVEEYKKEGWGIYDDTADVERAIALSDGYYGDQSSVVTLYQATGKPIMIQSYDRVWE